MPVESSVNDMLFWLLHIISLAVNIKFRTNYRDNKTD